MERTQADIFISGGGIAGLIAAAAFANQGLKVVLAEPSPPPNDASSTSSDLRSTAFLEPARGLLEDIGLWSKLADHATPLETLRVVDCIGHPPQIRTERAFKSSDLDAAAFGWNLPNWLTRKLLTDILLDSKQVDVRLGTGFKSILTRQSEAFVTLTDNTQLRTRLAVAADGRSSPLREACGIDYSTTRYGQKALAFVVSHDLPHENVSTELYLSGGAFTQVPLPDANGRHHSAIVWMNDGNEAARLMSLSSEEFAQAATVRSCQLLGNMALSSQRRAFPVVTQTANTLTSERVALIAEAAHVLPPIGAQGLNTSLHDVATLIELARNNPDDLGSAAFLEAYDAARATDIQLRSKTIDMYNRLCRSDDPPLQALRSLGLKAVFDIAPLRRRIMRAGLGG
ncbi:MAG: UbiH/UbiF family hydroxylase [Boseongicola sp.]|nr:MAG: UbiH/UbiF family hydroxylase [Boseongicola sp.]